MVIPFPMFCFITLVATFLLNAMSTSPTSSPALQNGGLGIIKTPALNEVVHNAASPLRDGESTTAINERSLSVYPATQDSKVLSSRSRFTWKLIYADLQSFFPYSESGPPITKFYTSVTKAITDHVAKAPHPPRTITFSLGGLQLSITGSVIPASWDLMQEILKHVRDLATAALVGIGYFVYYVGKITIVQVVAQVVVRILLNPDIVPPVVQHIIT